MNIKKYIYNNWTYKNSTSKYCLTVWRLSSSFLNWKVPVFCPKWSVRHPWPCCWWVFFFRCFLNNWRFADKNTLFLLILNKKLNFTRKRVSHIHSSLPVGDIWAHMCRFYFPNYCGLRFSANNAHVVFLKLHFIEFHKGAGSHDAGTKKVVGAQSHYMKVPIPYI